MTSIPLRVLSTTRFKRASAWASSRSKPLADVALVLGFAALYVLLLRSLFLGLGMYDVQNWDEARHAASAYEMFQRGDLLVNTYAWVPDYWNLKPPLSFWAIMLSYKVFGFTPFAMRFPSAVATIATVIVVGAFTHRRAGRLAALVATAAAVSCFPLLAMHSGRTADPDAIFILLMTCSVLCAVTAFRRPWALTGATLFFSLAFLTKSFHAVLALGFLVAFVLWVYRRSALSARHLLVALAGLVPLVAWAAARFAYDGTRFLTQMVTYDVLHRGSSAIEGHSEPVTFYLTLLQGTVGPWILVLFGAVCVLVAARRTTTVRSVLAPDEPTATWLGLAAWVLIVIGAFTFASTKLAWYVAPALPVLCVLVGVGLSRAVFSQRTGARFVLLGAACLALLLGESALTDARHEAGQNDGQIALASLNRTDAVAGAAGYLDPAMNGSDSAGAAWSQAMTAVAELRGDLHPVGTGLEGFLNPDGRAHVMFVHRGSGADRRLTSLGVEHVQDGSWYYFARFG